MAPEPVLFEEIDDEDCALFAIMMDPSGLEQAEFFWIDENNDDYCYRAYDFQWPWWRDRSDRSVDQGARSIGKALALDTPVLTTAGWRTMGTLVGGDIVYAPDGGRTCVEQAHRVMEGRPCFEVVFEGGERIVADADHRWVLAGGEIITTAQMSMGDSPRRVAVTRPLGTGDEGNLPVPPYALGAWLGDGSSYYAAITIGAEDQPEMRSLLAREGIETVPYSASTAFGLRWFDRWEDTEPKKKPGRGSNRSLSADEIRDLRALHRDGAKGAVLCDQFAISAATLNQIVTGKVYSWAGGPIRASRVGAGSFSAALNDLGLLGNSNKRVPDLYMYGSTAQRWALLEGLMDTDGHATAQGGCEITLTSEDLARDVQQLAGSLGEKVAFATKRASLNGRDCGPAYRMSWTPTQRAPFRLPRKKERCHPGSRTSVLRTRIVKKVAPTLSVPVRCITVDREDGQFLVGRSLIPTHNSEGIKAAVMAFPCIFPGQEHLIVAPEAIHVNALTERIEAQIRASWFYTELVVAGRQGIRHRPFHITWATAAQTITRLPQRSGIGLKGQHPLWLDVDEGQDISEMAWNEIPEIVRWEIPGAKMKIHGVSKGVRDHFFDITTKPDMGYTVHRYMAMHRPSWSKAMRAQQIKEYGSEESPDFLRNVYGEHGYAMNRIFVLDRLMRCVDTDEGSEYNLDEYQVFRITPDEISRQLDERSTEGTLEESSVAHETAILELLNFNVGLRDQYEIFWVGMDVGLVGDPSEILVFAEYTPKTAERKRDKGASLGVPDPGVSRLKLITRINIQRIPDPLQEAIVMHVINFYRPRAFGMDKTGVGFNLYQGLRKRAGEARLAMIDYADDDDEFAPYRQAAAAAAITKIKGYNFGAKVVVEIDTEKAAAPELAGAPPAEIIEKAGIKRYVKDISTDILRSLVDYYRVLLPYDGEVTNSLNGQTWNYSQEPVDPYGNRRMVFSGGKYHILDAARMAVLARALEPLEEMAAQGPAPAPDRLDYFG